MRDMREQSEHERRGRRSSPDAQRMSRQSSRQEVRDSGRMTSQSHVKSRTPERPSKRSVRSTSSSNARKTQVYESRMKSMKDRRVHDSERKTKESTAPSVMDLGLYSPTKRSPSLAHKHGKRSANAGKHSGLRASERPAAGPAHSHRHQSRSQSPPLAKKSKRNRNVSRDGAGKPRDVLERSGSIPRFKEMLATPPRMMEHHGGSGGGGGGSNKDGGGNMDRPLFRKDERSVDNVRNYDTSDRQVSGVQASSSGYKTYTKEELKKITVDIFRPMKEGTGGTRLNINPKDVVVVRRQGEGLRPIFDRDEIRQAQAERSDDFMERRVVAVVKERSRSPRATNKSDNFATENRENFQINADRFESQQQPRDHALDSVRPSLNDRWQKLEPRNVDYMDDDARKRKAFAEGPPIDIGGQEGYGNFPHYNYQQRGPTPRRSMSPTFRGPSPPPPQRRDQYSDYGRYQQNDPMEHRDAGDNRRMMYGSPDRNYSDSFNEENAMRGGRQDVMPPRDPQDLRHNLSKRRQSMDFHYSSDSNERMNFNERSGRASMRRSRSFERMERGAQDMNFNPDGRGNWNRDGRNQQQDRNFNRDDRHSDYNRNQQQRHGRQDFMDQPQRHRGQQQQQEQQQQQQEQLPNFSSRPDKYRYNEWMVKPDMVPRGSSYFEHDNRENRGGRGGFVRGGRGRGFFPRGSRGGGFFPRGRGGGGFGGNGGFNNGGREPDLRGRTDFHKPHHQQSSSYSHRNKHSPNHWKHDMFQNTPERDMDKPGNAT